MELCGRGAVLLSLKMISSPGICFAGRGAGRRQMARARACQGLARLGHSWRLTGQLKSYWQCCTSSGASPSSSETAVGYLVV